MKNKQQDNWENNLPAELAEPARRALTQAGYSRLEQLTDLTEVELKQLHGVGPKAIEQLRRALAARELSFAAKKRGKGYRVIRSGELPPSPWGTVKFEGEPYGGGVSFFLVNNEPGMGPDLHRHPYSETWIVRSGKARITAQGEDIEASPGDIVVVGPETPHKFKNIGAGRLEIICIHASPRIIQEELAE